MTGCTYCGTVGCEFETCPERLEDKFGTSADYDGDGEWVGERDKKKPGSEGAIGP